jgi:hypothetical protein
MSDTKAVVALIYIMFVVCTICLMVWFYLKYSDAYPLPAGHTKMAGQYQVVHTEMPVDLLCSEEPQMHALCSEEPQSS